MQQPLGRAVVIDKVGNRCSLFTLTISSLIDRHAEAVTCLPGVFQIFDTVEVLGSSPHGPTNLFNTLEGFLRTSAKTSPLNGVLGQLESASFVDLPQTRT